MTVYFRSDGNETVGTGHIMRCLSIAKALRAEGGECAFVCADDNAAELVSSAGFKHVILNTKWNDLNSETEEFISLIKSEQPHLVVLDTYYVSADYMRAVNGAVPTVYIDDLNAFDYPVSCVVNYNIYADELDYPPNKSYLLGTEYAPLREEFRGLQPMVRDSAADVLLSAGGADSLNLLERILDSFISDKRLEGLRFHAVIGSLNNHKRQLQLLVRKHLDTIMLHENVADMPKLMQSCDLAVSASGSTLYELCACGVPTATFAFADNQLLGARAFDSKEIMPYAGDFRDSADVVCERLCDWLADASNNTKRRQQTAKRMAGVVDGAGANRLVEQLILGYERNA